MDNSNIALLRSRVVECAVVAVAVAVGDVNKRRVI